jgi:DnaK suppressor protein
LVEIGKEQRRKPMTRNELKRFQTILAARVAELEVLGRQRDAIAVERSPDQLDEIQQASERALAVSNLDRNFSQLRSARAALRRIDEGDFGICQQCEEEIHLKRLAAVPWTSYCIECQEAADRNPNLDEMDTPTRIPLGRAA